MRIFFNYLKKYWRLLILALVLAAINQIFSLLDPYIFRLILDDFATKFEQLSKSEFFTGVTILLLLSMGTNLVSRIAKNFQDFYVNTITQKLGAKMYTDGLAHSLKLPYQVFEDQRSGETLEKLQRVRLDTQVLITSLINVVFTTLIGFVFVIIYAFSVSSVIAVVYLAMVPILGLLSAFLSKKIKVVQIKIVAQTTALAGSTTESLRNIELVKSLGLSDSEIKRLNDTTNDILKLELEKVKYLRALSFLQGTAINFLRTVILFVMMYLVFTRVVTLGEFFSLWIYSFFLFNPLQELGNTVNSYREAEASLENFRKILHTEKEPVPKNPKTIGRLNKIAFDSVSFQHPTANRNALDDMSFIGKSGETIAFVGPSGSGKTTLVKLLVGLYKPKTGRVLYNDINITEADLEKIRSQIGLVTQDTQLFAGTIRDNLKFANPKATDEQILLALKKSASNSLIQRATEGLDTVIGEGGVKVSGGEKQRLSIARALLRDPKLLVFDEATSSLDSLTEEQITSTIRELSEQNHVTVLIAHRLSTVMHADTIYVLEKGKIVESGSHQSLLDVRGLYSAMWRQQIGERS
ncbi:ABC transporter ATP-binding protein [Candidatus Nomurabacteria bacterium RIFCSPHIGHO2_02_FULL_37_45]|uniref:ABC transporter ATP-binding protein n=2 Tax=Candidatus Nomuraibacteriota TaxID=1752729 RepID=A0A1F6Y3X6_9BACT|nr:MAG: ABC transporter ATP-binding protein [Candidatus Nomurabacteria bacterium RIFCSPHIGHO2_01_FULL_37_110]OGI71409.1 MAG: ABC transporter ATP-binding protein [Candidatus Nomurabacteria bacterium RIFCSPHIGHO2_02_FULL_37_45]OGI79403.1 MAG: ABC transporter ATP-binding protein [Candidatus Nomurabacteria bacterium RIFCSPHIGHO2_12_FULL_37_29]OGI84778.1 MAG: ABC transporter ATP-binding protein [Candidatus Nomurabacteria bacterium RIFCSPLOWO2_01_FULL_37_49]OGJ01074.1 MAG: ABC transporter ATP-binding